MPIVNFGGNVVFTPRHTYAPKTEAEVLDILDRHAGGTIRVVASLHSWSEDTVSEDVIVDLRHFDAVAVEGEWATIGAGCVLSDALDRLAAHGMTVPTIGAVQVQRLGGLVSTATHGSGRPSLSHFMEALRVAAYDESGKARIFDFAAGDERLAARCAIGAMGVVLQVRFRCRPAYRVAETLVHKKTLDEALEGDFPLRQFVLVPWLWEYVVFQRRETDAPASWWRAVHHLYAFLGVDVLLHLLIKLLVTIGTNGWVRFFYRHVFLRLAWLDRTVIDDSRTILTLHHELWRHLEMELFVPERHLAAALAAVRQIVAVCDGSLAPDAVDAPLGPFAGELRALAGSYTHHYPIFIRHVLRDDTLISMTAPEACYSLSFFSYHQPREPFYAMAGLLAQALNRLYDARPHWGKYFPLQHADLARLYPRLADFRALCQRYDARGALRNRYVARVLGFNVGTESDAKSE